jgi:ubiquinone/menaquinone biosynthesis C-methylase UbiE
LGIDCFFAQRAAEATGFPDNHFDVIASNILHHEVNAAATDEIVAEAFRILRPGGIFYPIDHPTGKQAPKKTVSNKFWAFNDRAINNEVWRADFESRDFAEIIRKAGFVVDESLPPAVWGTGSIKAVKPA